MLQTNPYWASYHPHHAAALLSSVDSMYLRNGMAAAAAVAALPVTRPVIPRVFMPGIAQNVSPLPPPPPH
ncbi:hypothetical protein C0Q70_17997 [Pomacea canaliculata]|uniref:Uncharacterized protein n=1 Tax=Pomacea canaliculata TaxID=400727 RepID=A0A2T7NM01_POMCA|nr:hypothetical protein C0Q70_17997 [Pomacea canaliculata]